MKAKKLRDGSITVNFDPPQEWYYAHGIREIGKPTDSPGKHLSMWGWINHLRDKNWWNDGMEARFMNVVMEALD